MWVIRVLLHLEGGEGHFNYYKATQDHRTSIFLLFCKQHNPFHLHQPQPRWCHFACRPLRLRSIEFNLCKSWRWKSVKLTWRIFTAFSISRLLSAFPIQNDVIGRVGVSPPWSSHYSLLSEIQGFRMYVAHPSLVHRNPAGDAGLFGWMFTLAELQSVLKVHSTLWLSSLRSLCVKQPKMSQLIQEIVQHGLNGLQRFWEKAEPFIRRYSAQQLSNLSLVLHPQTCKVITDSPPPVRIKLRYPILDQWKKHFMVSKTHRTKADWRLLRSERERQMDTRLWAGYCRFHVVTGCYVLREMPEPGDVSTPLIKSPGRRCYQFYSSLIWSFK